MGYNHLIGKKGSSYYPDIETDHQPQPPRIFVTLYQSGILRSFRVKVSRVIFFCNIVDFLTFKRISILLGEATILPYFFDSKVFIYLHLFIHTLSRHFLQIYKTYYMMGLLPPSMTVTEFQNFRFVCKFQLLKHVSFYCGHSIMASQPTPRKVHPQKQGLLEGLSAIAFP